jgi:SpoVK/Ycf46/Vps4 family AAA+-type ATPase
MPTSKEKSKDKSFTKYKFNAIKIYSSDEWMANSTKRYRTVFDRMETNYMRAEFSFFNKLFDEEEWETTVNLKAFKLDGSNKTELCNLDSKITVKTDENIVYVRDGWGNETYGTFWKRGDYQWEAYLDNEFVGSAKFYIEDVGVVTNDYNPYMEIESIKLYSGPFEVMPENESKYLVKFNRDETLYVWVECKIKNKTSADWFCELFYNFYDDARQLKGQTDTLNYIDKNKQDEKFSYEAGWGNKTTGSWKHDKYTVEIVFMDTLLAIVPFEVGAEEVEGEVEILGNNLSAVPLKKGTEKTAESLEDIMKQLNELIGLQEVKKEIKDHISYLNFIKLRKEKGFEDSEKMSLHSVFTGNPGTGKTTVVNLLGKIYNKMGLLSKGHVKEVDRSDLVGEYIGQTAPRVKKLIDEARGGILFIDEAYALSREDDKDFGKEAIEILIKEMSDGKGDIAIMCAGYPKEMKHFLESNPGMKSRFNYYFHFDDYVPDELEEIALFACTKRSVKLTDEAKTEIRKILVEAFRNRNDSFGNARFAFSLIDEAKMNLGLRLMTNPDVANLTEEALQTIELADVEPIIAGKQKKKLNFEVDELRLKESLHELNSLVGLINIKDEINELVKLVRYYRETGKHTLNKFSLHTVFTGNPGTGKTTVARIIGGIYKSLGLLEKGHVVETDREGLIAGYVGQTALKTKVKIDEAMGGVLFIDEAYALSDGSNNDFGKEAIEIILKNMEDNRGKFAVIVAGYPDNMSNFLLSNPGLKSRFDRVLNFIDYTSAELYDIAVGLLAKENLKADAKAEEHLRKYFDILFSKKDKYFGNARTVRNVVGEAIKNQNLRMASMPSAHRTKEMLDILTLDDVKEFTLEETQTGKKLGFKLN